MIFSILGNRKIVYISFPLFLPAFSFVKVFRSQRLLNYIDFTTRVSFIKIVFGDDDC